MKIFLRTLTLMFLAISVPSTAQNITSSADPRATAAGQEMLRAGGSAADAAMAMMLVLTVVEPQSSGIGGGGFFLYHDAKSGKMATIDGREKAPKSATPERFLGPDGKPRGFRDIVPGGLSVGVPGNIRLMQTTHKKWGKLPWAKIFEPAIRISEEGFIVNKTLNKSISMMAPVWADFPDMRALYFVGGKPAPVGARIKNPAFAKMLRDVAKRGADAFYTGLNAQAIVTAVNTAPKNTGDMTLADLQSYTVKERDAVCFPYRQFRLCGMGPPSSGATTVFQILGILETYDMKKMGKDNPMSWHLLSEAMRLAYADRETYLGDPDFVDVPVAGLLDKNYLAKRRTMMSPFAVMADYPSGMPPGAKPRTSAISGEKAGTTHYVAVDKDGNVASMTSTVEGPFGAQIMANGMVLNNELTDFTHAPMRNGAPVANRVEGGKRPLSSMSPTIVYGPDGNVVLALGSAGGKRIIMHVTKTLIGVLDWDLPADQAIALPNIYFGGDGTLIENTAEGQKLAGELTQFGRPAISSDLGSKVNAAQKINGTWVGAADPRGEGTASSE